MYISFAADASESQLPPSRLARPSRSIFGINHLAAKPRNELLSIRLDAEAPYYDHGTTQLLLDIRKHIVEETVSMNPAFDYEGLDEEVAQALVDLSYYGERDRAHLTRYARARANQFV